MVSLPWPPIFPHIVVEEQRGEAGRVDFVQELRELGAVQRVLGAEEQPGQDALLDESDGREDGGVLRRRHVLRREEVFRG